MPNFTVTRHGTDSSGRAIYLTAYMQAWVDGLFEACAARGFTPTIVQGAFMTKAGGGASASAGYHDLGGCIDIRVWDLTTDQWQFVIREARRRGAAAYRRDQAHGGMAPHIHLVLGGDRPLAQGAADQWLDYLNGGNGLTGRSAGHDYHWRPNPLVTSWNPPADAKPTPNITDAFNAPDLEARKRALRRVIHRGAKPARRAARAWLAAILAREAAVQKARAARGDLRDLEVR